MARLCFESPGAFFPPLQEGDETPEFVRWAMEYACRPREQHVGNNLESLFRQLRPLAALGDAQRESRLTQNHRAFACDRTLSYEFDATEILSFYGASALTEVPCLTCPANASSERFPNCIGIISRSNSIEPFIDALASEAELLSTLIPVTSPRWYGFWVDSPLQGERLRNSASLVDSILAGLKVIPMPLAALQSAMHTACERKAPFHVQLNPPGAVRDGRWEIPAHCGYCGGLRAPRQRVCKICHREKAWKSAEKRHLIGIRPYREVKPNG
jgi:hypothetical protein